MAGPKQGKKAALPIPMLILTGGGTVLVTILAFAPSLLPSIVQRYAYMLFRTPLVVKVVAVPLLLAHVFEASTAWKMCQKRSLAPSTSLYYAALTLVCGFPVLQTLKKIKGP